MPGLMRCQYCGLLQDEPAGVKECARCGGELAFETQPTDTHKSYIQVQMELEQIASPAGRNSDRYLLVTIRTPHEVPAAYAAATSSGRAALSFAAILDVSGSMQGEKIARAREAVQQSLRHLQDDDIFSLVLFSDLVRCAFEPARLNAANRKVLESAIREVRAGGMTALCGGLETGLEKIRRQPQDTNLALLLSDGIANVGETDLEKIGLRAAEARTHNITTSTIGVGNDYNEALMAEIASRGGGRFYHIQNAAQIPAFLTGELGEAAHVAGRRAVIHLAIPDGATVMPLSLAYPAQQGGGMASVSIGDLPADTELEIPLRISLAGQPAGSKASLDGWLEYAAPSGAALKAALNRVSVRFVDAEAFNARQGVVVPVAERVLEQIKAAGVLGVSRAMSKDPEEAARQSKIEKDVLYSFAEKLGNERAIHEVDEMDNVLFSIAASPAAAKLQVSRSHSRQRGTKNHGGT